MKGSLASHFPRIDGVSRAPALIHPAQTSEGVAPQRVARWPLK
jgi:hypothetical protein